MTINSTTMEYQKVIDYIFQMIKDRKLIVGSKIPSERDIAEQLGIGRNSTREAISLMRGMGLIESRHGSGNYIAKNSDRTISSIVSVMLALGSISMKDILEFRKIISRTVIALGVCFQQKHSSPRRRYLPVKFNVCSPDLHSNPLSLVYRNLNPVSRVCNRFLKFFSEQKQNRFCRKFSR